MKETNYFKNYCILFLVMMMLLIINRSILKDSLVYADTSAESVTGGVVEIVTEPALSNVKAQSITVTGAVISVSCDKNATLYYIVLEDVLNTPTKDQIKFGVSSSELIIIEKGSVTSNGKNDSIIILTELVDDTSYAIYIYADDLQTDGSSITSYKFVTNTFYRKVYYDSNGSTSGSIPVDDNKYNIGESIIIMDNIGNLYRKGFYFAGWNTKSNGSGINRVPYSAINMPYEDLILYAKWIPEKYYIKYNGNDHNKGSVPSSNIYHRYNDATTISYPGSMGKLGYTFVEWNTKPDGTGKTYKPGEKVKMPDSDIKLYAIWTEVTYVVKFDTKGGTKAESQKIPYGEYVKSPQNVYMSGYRLVGWFTSSEYTVEYDIKNKPITSNITLYAKWEKLVGKNEVVPIPIEYDLYVFGEELENEKSIITTADILFNSKVQNVGSVITSTTDNRSITKIIFDNINFQVMIKELDANSVVTIPVKSRSETVIGQLNGETVKEMADKNIILDFQTEIASYRLLTSEINPEFILENSVEFKELNNVNIQIVISKVRDDKIESINKLAEESAIHLFIDPVEFNVRYLINGRIYEKERYSTYVERSLLLPDNIDYEKITTGLIIDSNGVIRHVPSKIESIYGKYYVTYKSMTNGIYSIAWIPVTFNDIENHWAKKIIENIGSKLIVTGDEDGNFLPDENITRAELTVVLTKALGIPKSDVDTYFDDVSSSDWFAGYINSSVDYKLIDRIDNFQPNDFIEREEAMLMFGRALNIIGINDRLSNEDIDDILAKFSDSIQLSESAREKIALCIKYNLIKGRDDHIIAPHDMLTRAEVVTMISEMLKKFN